MKTIEVKVIEILPKWWLAQWETTLPDGTEGKLYVQRKLIPWAAFPVSVKGPVRIPVKILDAGMEYSDVLLSENLGVELPTILPCDVEDAMRRAGLWTQKDYKDHPQVIAGVLQKLRGVDVARVIQAATMQPKETD